VRIVLVPGRVAPGNGQMTLVETARLLDEAGVQGVTFVLAGDVQHHKRYVRSIMTEAQSKGVAALFRMVGHSTDMAAAYAAADVVVVPYVAAPVLGRVVAEAQAMAKPVIATTVGSLAENMVTPPAMPDELRTGWLVPPDHPAELALALRHALALDAAAHRAMAARARQFAEFTFAPDRVAAATLEVYASLLESKD
jgi:glycosyltransferase involved in cell wall biosynthesis